MEECQRLSFHMQYLNIRGYFWSRMHQKREEWKWNSIQYQEVGSQSDGSEKFIEKSATNIERSVAIRKILPAFQLILDFWLLE